jgi:hypothetical protein
MFLLGYFVPYRLRYIYLAGSVELGVTQERREKSEAVVVNYPLSMTGGSQARQKKHRSDKTTDDLIRSFDYGLPHADLASHITAANIGDVGGMQSFPSYSSTILGSESLSRGQAGIEVHRFVTRKQLRAICVWPELPLRN